jgi:RHS repeat-associated protein
MKRHWTALRCNNVFAGCVIALVTFACLPLSAQDVSDNTIGIPQSSSTFPVEHGVVNLNHGFLHLEIPIENYIQRGDIKLPATLVYDSNIWTVVNPCGQDCAEWTLASWWGPFSRDSYGGWRLEYGGGTGISSDNYTVECQPNQFGQIPAVYVQPDVIWYDSHGTLHLFPASVVSVPAGCQASDGNSYQDIPSASAYATDTSGYFAAVTNYGKDVKIWDAKGTEVASLGDEDPTPIDRNGNHISSSNGMPAVDVDPGSVQDTLNRTLIHETTQYAYPGDIPSVEYIDVPLANGGTGRYTIHYELINVQTDFNYTFESQLVPEMNGQIIVISEIDLPDGSFYSFGYEDGTYGELNSIKLPHGGNVSLSYETASFSGLQPSRKVKSHTGSDGTTTFAWSYQSSSSYTEAGTSCGAIQNTVTSPRASNTYTFSACNGSVVPRIVTHSPVGSSQVDATELYGYDLSHACPTIGTNQIYHVCYGAEWRTLTDKTIVLPNAGGSSGLTTDTQYGYAVPGVPSPSSIKEWDYYSTSPATASLPDSPPGIPARETDQTLGYVVNHAYFPTLVTHKDSTGAPAETTTYTYDEAAYTSPTPSGAPNHDSSFVTGPRGNVTTVSQCCAIVGGASVSLVSHTTYDDAGSVVAIQDPNGKKTSIAYDATDTFPFTVTLPTTVGSDGATVNHLLHATHDPNSGQVTSITDQNSQTTTYAYDSAGRPYTVVFSNGGSPVTLQTTTYPSANETDVSTLRSSGVTLSSSTIVDGYGRVTQSEQSGVATTTTYDAQGRVYSVTNPQLTSRSSTDGATVYGYDELGRVNSVKLPNGYSTTLSYSQNTVTATDPLGHSRMASKDAFGDLMSLTEPDSSNTLDWTSVYAYNWQGQLIQVDQKGSSGTDSTQWRTRYFNYDGIGRLTSESTPEAGTTSFSYDYNGNVLFSKNANSANNTTQYLYDADNRPTFVGVAGGPSYTYTYDGQDASGDPYGIGLLTGTTNGSNVQTLATHDPLGRTITQSYCLPSDCSFSYKIAAAYDFQNNLTLLTYPDGRVITQTYDQLNRPQNVTYAQWGSTNINTPYAANLSYEPTGHLQQATFGSQIRFGAVYDGDDNLTALTYVAGSTPLASKTYTWDNNASNLRTINDSASGRTQSFTYDQLDRVQSMTDTGTTSSACVSSLPSIPQSAQSFTLDAWGNLKQSGTYSFSQFPVLPNQNRVTGSGYVYDAAGNMTADGLGTSYQYRSDGLLTSSDGETYTYDALGQRVRKDGAGSNEYVYFGGQLVAMHNPSTGVWTDRIYGPNGVFATVAGTQTATPIYRVTDHLGSLNMLLDSNGNVLGAANALPYGQTTSNTTSDSFLFTDHERDANQSDAALFRHFSSAQGRWLAPDPSDGSYRLTDPQSFNRYAYLSNRPMAAVDRFGLDGDDDDGGGGCGCDGGGGGGGFPGFPGQGDSGGFPGSGQSDPTGPSSGFNASSDPSAVPTIEVILHYMGADAGFAAYSTVDWSFGIDSTQPAGGDWTNPYFEAWFRNPEARNWFVGSNRVVTRATEATAVVYGGVAGALAIDPAVGFVASRIGLYQATATGTGVAVLGRYRQYLEDAKDMGANVFSLPPKVYNFFDYFGHAWTANRAFLDRVVSTGQRVYLSSPPLGQWNSTFGAELDYLTKLGKGADSWTMVVH